MKENNFTLTINNILPEWNLSKIKDKINILKCNTCKVELLEVAEILDIKTEFNIKAFCSCGGSSFIIKTEGKPYVTNTQFSKIEDIKYDLEFNKMEVICKKLK